MKKLIVILILLCVSAVIAVTPTVSYVIWADKLPKGATLVQQGDTLHADFTWTPEYNQAGTYYIKINASKIATDSNGVVTILKNSTWAKITVHNTPRAPWWKTILNFITHEKKKVTWTMEAYDPDIEDPDVFDPNFSDPNG